MSKISVVMPVYNAEKTVAEAIESVLKQTFKDFELIIIDDGSEDNTLSIIHSFSDHRIVLLRNNHNFFGSLNMGLQRAKGKYIARMDAEDVMHIDRLKIQHAIMEEEPEITICSTWITPFGDNVSKGNILHCAEGLIEYPVLQLLKGNFLYNPTVIIRKDFIIDNGLQYENYACEEDYKLWFEAAKLKGVFYIESQPLLYYRVSETQVSRAKKDKQPETACRIKYEILDYLIELTQSDHPEVKILYNSILALENKGLFSSDHVFSFFFSFFIKNKLIFFPKK